MRPLSLVGWGPGLEELPPWGALQGGAQEKGLGQVGQRRWSQAHLRLRQPRHGRLLQRVPQVGLLGRALVH